MAFHVVTRLIDRAHHFKPEMQLAIVRVIAEASHCTDAQVLAFAVMDSHLHLVVRQCEDPLFRLMQPALRRIALMVQKTCRVEGHVFEREFKSFPCLTASYLREAIVYTHLNPVRAGIVKDPWGSNSTSHAAYTDVAMQEHLTFVKPAIELFAEGWSASRSDCRKSYGDFVAFRMACDRCDADGLPRPFYDSAWTTGDDFFARTFATSATEHAQVRRMRRDLRDIVVDALAIRAPETPVSALRGGFLPSRHLQRLRHEIVGIAAREGHSGRSIARYFLMSTTRVSQIARASQKQKAGHA
jgi:REP element-mobilizing transposase RayT